MYASSVTKNAARRSSQLVSPVAESLSKSALLTAINCAPLRSQFSAVSDTVEGEVSAFLADLAEEGFVGYEVQGAQA